MTIKKACFPLLLPCLLLASCAQLPERTAGPNQVVSAHAVQVFRLGTVSWLRASSFVIGEPGNSPSFSRQALYESDTYPGTSVHASDALVASGFDAGAAEELALDLDRMHAALPRYLGTQAPVRRLGIGLVAPDEHFEQHASSLSLARSHHVRMAFRFSSDDRAGSSRSIVRTTAHELTHLSLAVHGRAEKSGVSEERAAYAMEHCVELDVFGTTAAPRRLSPTLGHQDDAVSDSIRAGYLDDPELDALFDEDRSLPASSEEALRNLCSQRVQDLRA